MLWPEPKAGIVMVAKKIKAKATSLVCAKILLIGMSFSAVGVIQAQESQATQEPEQKQERVIEDPKVEEQIQAKADNAERAIDSSNQQPILRLEDTIRGNKEQPQVLTIVPWQLPVHQRINENEEWQLQVNKLPSIERNAFLRRLAVVNEMKGVQPTQIANTAQTDTPDK